MSKSGNYNLSQVEERDDFIQELLGITRRIVAWDKKYPKGTVWPMSGERELDAIINDAEVVNAKAEGD